MYFLADDLPSVQLEHAGAVMRDIDDPNVIIAMKAGLKDSSPVGIDGLVDGGIITPF